MTTPRPTTTTANAERHKQADVVISGAAGFIGRRLSQTAAARYGHAATLCLVWNRPHETDDEGLAMLESDGLRRVPVDLVTKEGLDALPKAPRRIFHLAGSVETIDDDHRCNDLGTRNLVEALGPLTRDTHLVYVSSGAVNDHRADYSSPLSEGTLVDEPETEYGKSKLRSEQWLRSQCKRDGFRLTIVRLSTVWGVAPRPRSLFDEMPRLVRGRSPIARLNWPGLTTLVHVQDVADALIRLAESPPEPGEPELYLLGAESVTLAEISRQLHGALEIEYRPVRLPRAVWACLRLVTRPVRFRRMLPARARNNLWRASLIIDNVIWYDLTKVRNALPDWRPRHFQDSASEVLQ